MNLPSGTRQTTVPALLALGSLFELIGRAERIVDGFSNP
jgi:hypothetical protein